MQHASGPGQLSLMGEVLPVPMVVSPVVAASLRSPPTVYKHTSRFLGFASPEAPSSPPPPPPPPATCESVKVMTVDDFEKKKVRNSPQFAAIRRNSAQLF